MNEDDILNQYGKFVEGQLSETSSNANLLVERIEELDEEMNASAFILAGLGVAGEAGEITDMVKKIVYHGKPYNDENRQKIIDEAGDTLFYIQTLCYAIGVNLEDIILANVKKLQKRYPDGKFTFEHCENRTD